MARHAARVKERVVCDSCPTCGKESTARLRSGRTVFVCINGHKHGKVMKFRNGKEHP